MLIAAVILLGSSAALVALSLIIMAFAPQGYEDETGFHLGPEETLCPQEAYIGTFSEAKVIG